MAWEQNIEADVVANIPNTNARVNGALFFATDEQKAYRNDLGGSGWVEVLAGGAGGSWTVIDSWLHSVSGDTASPISFTGLGAYNEIMVLLSQLDRSVSSTPRVVVGHGGGPTYLTGSEYVVLADDGSETTTSNFSLTAGSDTDPHSGFVRISMFNLAAPKPALVPQRSPEVAWYINDTNQLTAVRVQTSTGTGNFNGGAIYVYGR